MPIGFKLENKILSEIKNNNHNSEIWIGNDGAGNAEEDSLTPFQVSSGNNVFGSEVQILDVSDTPIRSGNNYFDISRIFFTDTSLATAYYLRIIFGTGTIIEAENAKQYTTIPLIQIVAGAKISGNSNSIYFPAKIPVGNKIWAKCKNATNSATMDFIFGLREY